MSQWGERDFMFFIVPNSSLLRSMKKICDLFSVSSECIMGRLFISINTYIIKLNKLGKHLGIMPGEKSCQCFTWLVLLVND